MRISVKFKLLPIILIGIAILTGMFYYTFINAQQENLHMVSDDAIKTSKEMFYNLEKDDIKMLSSTIEALQTNKEMKDIYLKKDREQLYNYVLPTHTQLKIDYGMTHFYFHLPNGTNFVRIHSKAKFGDNITRKTYQKSVQSNGFGTGLELGATAFALRVVHPYYDGTTLIGYIELGEEIDHFLKIMKTQTGNDYGLFIKKEYIKHEDWKAMLDTKGLRDNYDDMKDYVMIDTTSESISSFVASEESKLSTVSEEGDSFDKYSIKSSTYITGGFPLYDAGGLSVGTVVVVKDVSEHENATRERASMVLIISLISAIVVSIIVVLLVNLYILKPLNKIVDATTLVAGGDFSAEIKRESDDEIGDLAMMIEGFKKILVGTANDLEKAQERKD